MDERIEKYGHYELRDFLLDDDFVAWCKNLPEADNELWERVLKTYPDLADKIVNAKEFLLHSVTRDQLPTDDQIQKMWRVINAETFETKSSGIVRKLSRLRVAAIVLLVVGAGVFSYLAYTKDTKVSTLYAEIKQLELPDHSKVTLNANSEIRYSEKWNTIKPREVWLTGEAYFDVTHLHKGATPAKPGERFIVHINGLDVEVLGTSFNVNNRHDAAQITLTSGSIELRFPDNKHSAMIMKPGEIVKYSKGSLTIENEEEKSSAASAWKEHRWEFDDASLKDVLQLLKDNYGLDAKVENEKLWNKKISGAISSDNKEILLSGLSILLDIKIEQKNGTIILK
ncbi:FecR family protein [Pinibacter soli]|uniref:FecR domain-containing protein n=1 Tax=Pinibacter soli TaxID=3044211 RepID=A0ABT6RGQ1_9BACT|nr:FecR family protein [Pinibacter soli]MDI3321740.1 FecR domain-containing protein [Pinibacter soli]